MGATSMTLPKSEAGTVAVPGSVLHQFSDTHDLAKTRSSRGFGVVHHLLERRRLALAQGVD